MGLKVDRETEAKILALAGQSRPTRAPSPKRERESPAAPVPVRLVVGPIPVKLASEANAGGRLRSAIGRKAEVKAAVRAALAALTPPPLPVAVVLTRLGGRKLDAHDNLPRSLKAVVDAVAEWLGVDDADPRVRWVIRQRPGWAAGVEIDVRTTGATG